MSLPPIPRVTKVVARPSACNCGGFVPRPTPSDPVMFVVSAPWQLTSVNEDGPIAAATSEG